MRSALKAWSSLVEAVSASSASLTSCCALLASVLRRRAPLTADSEAGHVLLQCHTSSVSAGTIPMHARGCGAGVAQHAACSRLRPCSFAARLPSTAAVAVSLRSTAHLHSLSSRPGCAASCRHATRFAQTAFSTDASVSVRLAPAGTAEELGSQVIPAASHCTQLYLMPTQLKWCLDCCPLLGTVCFTGHVHQQHGPCSAGECSTCGSYCCRAGS